jgi:hypothetical protein
MTEDVNNGGAATVICDFKPLSSVLAVDSNEIFDERLSRITLLSRARLIDMYRTVFASNQRYVAFLCAEALTKHGVPPCFRLDRPHRASDLNANQRFDLIAADLRWLAARYPEQRQVASGGYQYLLAVDGWLERAEHLWATKHMGETWILVRQLALTTEQQWECAGLRSQPIKRAAQGLDFRREKVSIAIMAKLPEAMLRRTKADATETLERRYRVWVCSEMTVQGPTNAARLYNLWTGENIDRRHVARDLNWIHQHVPESRPRT